MAKLDLAAVGEFGLIEAIRRRAAAKVPGRWALAIGDDAAILRPRAGTDVVVSVDALVEDVHFRWSMTDARSVGEKALAVNLSDLAAMGARPLGCLLTLAVPADVAAERLDAFLRGFLARAKRAGCPLVGGDTTRSPAWSISVTALGEVARGAALRRSGARPGDRLFVTGALGSSAAGLAVLERGAAPAQWEKRLVNAHNRPRSRVDIGPKLVRAGATAAIDVSDGLVSDVAHVARESGVQIDVDLDAVPVAPGVRAASKALGLDALALAVAGGEDYELLFTLAGPAPTARVLAKRLGCRTTEIGRVARGQGVRFTRKGAPVAAPDAGWDHFKDEHRGTDG